MGRREAPLLIVSPCTTDPWHIIIYIFKVTNIWFNMTLGTPGTLFKKKKIWVTLSFFLSHIHSFPLHGKYFDFYYFLILIFSQQTIAMIMRTPYTKITPKPFMRFGWNFLWVQNECTRNIFWVHSLLGVL